jgi:hypothetical protein
METSERLVFFRAIPYSLAFNDMLRILKRNSLGVLESDFEGGLIRAEGFPSQSSEPFQIIAKFWKGKDRILIGLRGSLSLSLSGAERLKKKLERLETDLRRLDYAY